MTKTELQYVEKRIRRMASDAVNKRAKHPGDKVDGIKAALREGKPIRLKPASVVKAYAKDTILSYAGTTSISLEKVFEIPVSYTKDMGTYEKYKREEKKRIQAINALKQAFIDDVMCGVREGRRALVDFENEVSKI